MSRLPLAKGSSPTTPEDASPFHHRTAKTSKIPTTGDNSDHDQNQTGTEYSGIVHAGVGLKTNPLLGQGPHW